MSVLAYYMIYMIEGNNRIQKKTTETIDCINCLDIKYLE